MKGMYLGRRFYRQMFALVLVMILAPEGLAAQDAIATALDRIHREYSSGPMDTARLVLLDRELRELIPHYSWQERPWLRATYFESGLREHRCPRRAIRAGLPYLLRGATC